MIEEALKQGIPQNVIDAAQRSPVYKMAMDWKLALPLHDMTGADSSVSKCYFTRAKSGVLMKSLTIAIRNREQRVIGLLCINMNLDVPFSQIMSTFVPPEPLRPQHQHLHPVVPN